MKSNGYVLIHRSLLANKVFRDKTEAWAFADLILQAAWQPTTAHYKGRTVALERGQVCISVRDFAAQWGRSSSWSQRFFDRLFKAKMLIQNRYTTDTPSDTPPNVITVCNYDKYQQVKGKADTVAGTEPIQDRYTEQGNKEGMKKRETPSGVSPRPSPKMPLQEAVDNWNSMAARHGWKQILSLNDKRSEHLRCRLREHGLKGWILALHKAAASPYLGGSDPPPWFSFDWLAKSPTNFLKLMEGNYDRSRSDQSPRDPTVVALEQLSAIRSRATSH